MFEILNKEAYYQKVKRNAEHEWALAKEFGILIIISNENKLREHIEQQRKKKLRIDYITVTGLIICAIFLTLKAIKVI